MPLRPTMDFEALNRRLMRGVETARPLVPRGRVVQVVGTIIQAYAPV